MSYRTTVQDPDMGGENVVEKMSELTDNPLILILEFFVILLSSWTSAYHICLWAGIASGLIWIPFVSIFLMLLSSIFYGREATTGLSSSFWGPYSCTLTLAVCCGLFTLVLNRPDADDVTFFHRCLIQLTNLQDHFGMMNTHFDEEHIPPLSLLHQITSYELLLAFAGKLFSVDPLWMYQNGGAFFAAFLFVLVFWSIYRELGLSPWVALVATLTAIVFLFSDGNLHRSFGNMAFVRFWQGKTILWILWVPTAFFFQYRFLNHPTSKNLLILFLVGVSSVGLSSSSVMMMPMYGLVVSLAFLVSSKRPTEKLGTSIKALLAYSYPVAVGAYFWLGPKFDMTVWATGWQPVWYLSLYQYMIGSAATLLRDFCFLFLVPLVALPRKSRILIVSISLISLLLFANPITGPILVKIFTPNSYWRLWYTLPFPLTAGLLVCCFYTKDIPGKKKIASVMVGIFALVTTAYAFEKWTLEVSNDCHLKHVGDIKLPQKELAFSRVVAGKVPAGATILAPEAIAWVMALVNPTFRFISVRSAETLHAFKNANRLHEGQARVEAQRMTVVPNSNADDFKVFTELAHRIDYVVAPEIAASDLCRFLLEVNYGCVETIRQEGYVMVNLKKTGTNLDSGN